MWADCQQAPYRSSERLKHKSWEGEGNFQPFFFSCSLWRAHMQNSLFSCSPYMCVLWVPLPCKYLFQHIIECSVNVCLYFLPLLHHSRADLNYSAFILVAPPTQPQGAVQGSTYVSSCLSPEKRWAGQRPMWAELHGSSLGGKGSQSCHSEQGFKPFLDQRMLWTFDLDIKEPG